MEIIGYPVIRYYEDPGSYLQKEMGSIGALPQMTRPQFLNLKEIAKRELPLSCLPPPLFGGLTIIRVSVII